MSASLRLFRLVAVGASFVFAVIAAIVGLRALIKKSSDIDGLMKMIPPGIVADVDVNDVIVTGKIAAGGSIVIAVFSAAILSMSLMKRTKTLAENTYRTQALVLLVPVLLVFAGMVPYMVYFCSRGPKVYATLNGAPLPLAIVDQAIVAAGFPLVYKDIEYLKLLAIFPWLSLPCSLVAVAVLFHSGSVASRSSDSGSWSESEKPYMNERERA